MMKKLINKVAGYCSLTLLFPLLAACSSDSPSGPYKDLKQVNFPQEKSKVLETIPTGQIVDGYNQLLEVYTVQETLDPISTVERETANSIFPGVLLYGEFFMQGELKSFAPVKPVKRPLTLQVSADKSFNLQSLPFKEEVTACIKETVPNAYQDVYSQKKAWDYIDISAVDMTTAESCNKIFHNFHLKAALDNWLERAFGLYEKEYRAKGPHYVALKVRQKFFSVSLPAVRPADWGELTDVGTYEPIYVSDVDYGREINLVVRTEMRGKEFEELFRKALQTRMDPKSHGLYDQEKEKLDKMLQSGEISVAINQGPKSNYVSISRYQTLWDFLDMPSDTEFFEYCTPIAYKVKAVRDNRPIVVRASHTEQRLIKGEKAK